MTFPLGGRLLASLGGGGGGESESERLPSSRSLDLRWPGGIVEDNAGTKDGQEARLLLLGRCTASARLGPHLGGLTEKCEASEWVALERILQSRPAYIVDGVPRAHRC